MVVAPASDGLSAAHPVPLGSIAAHPVVMPAPGHGLRALIDQAAARAQVEINCPLRAVCGASPATTGTVSYLAITLPQRAQRTAPGH